MLWLDFMAKGFRNTGIGWVGRGWGRGGGSICAAELVSALQNIGQHCNLFVCYSHFLGPHHFIELNSVDRRVMQRQIMHGSIRSWRLKILEIAGN